MERALGKSNTFFFRCCSCGSTRFVLSVEQNLNVVGLVSFNMFAVCSDCGSIHKSVVKSGTNQKGFKRCLMV